MGGCARWQRLDCMQPTVWRRSQTLTATAGTRAVELLPHDALAPSPLQATAGSCPAPGAACTRWRRPPSGEAWRCAFWHAGVCITQPAYASMCCALSTAGSTASPGSPLRCSPWHPLPPLQAGGECGQGRRLAAAVPVRQVRAAARGGADRRGQVRCWLAVSTRDEGGL